MTPDLLAKLDKVLEFKAVEIQTSGSGIDPLQAANFHHQNVGRSLENASLRPVLLAMREVVGACEQFLSVDEDNGCGIELAFSNLEAVIAKMEGV